MVSVDTLIIGNLVLDRNNNGKYEGPGGSSYFIAKALNLLGVQSTIVSQRGDDYPKKYLQNLNIFPEHPVQSNTIIFENNTVGGKRIQKTINWDYAHLPFPSDMSSDVMANTRYLIFCPIIDNLSLNKLKEWKGKINPKKSILLPQGLLRKISEDGTILKQEPLNLEKYIVEVDYVIYSDEDILDSHKKAEQWSKKGPIVIVTLDKLGCDVYIKGIKKHFDTYPNNNIKSLIGLGDVFAAVFFASIVKGKSIDEAIKLANAGASLAKSFDSQNLHFTFAKIEDIVKTE